MIRTKLRTALGAAAIGAWALAPAALTPAAADTMRLAQAAPAPIPSYEAMTVARSAGLDPVGRPVLRGRNWVMRAIDEYGVDVRVLVDARRARVVSVRPVEPVVAEPVYIEPEPLPPEAYRAPSPRVYEIAPPSSARDWPSTARSYPDYVPEHPDFARLPAGPRVIPAPGHGPVPGAPRVISTPGQDVTGSLPRQRPAVRRTAAALPAHPPLPRPRPLAAVPEPIAIPGGAPEAAAPTLVGPPESAAGAN